MASDSRFSLFPVVGLPSSKKGGWSMELGEISFSGKVQNYCVCFIDIIGSTKISSELTPSQLSKYYAIFLNAMALVAKNFGATVVKNVGDGLIFYFEDTSDPASIAKFRNVLDCGLTMGLASKALNARMLSEKLPPIQYRISAEYGQISIARSQSSQSDDLFGPAMNYCAKINRMARPNSLIVGDGLFQIVKNLEGYSFSRTESVAGSSAYFGYHIDSTEPLDVINPFERRATG